MNGISMIDPSNPLELEAQADELEAEALQLRARAKRRRLQLEAAPPSRDSAADVQQLTREQYARRANVSAATVSRFLRDGMPFTPVGVHVRIDPALADEWRRARGRRPTTAAAAKPKPDDEADVTSALARAGLSAVGGRS